LAGEKIENKNEIVVAGEWPQIADSKEPMFKREGT